MTYRNRELLSLGVVGVITGLGFASVYIARQEVISTASLSYGAFFLCLYLAAHLVARFTVPNADPYLLPLVALLTAIGVTEIYRIEPDDALRQTTWIVVGVAAMAAVLVAFRRDYRRLEGYKYLFGVSAVILLALPVMPVIGRTVNGARLWVEVGPVGFQPGELAKVFLIVFLAAYLREKREVLAQARLKDLGPLLLFFGAAMLVLVITSDLGSALLSSASFSPCSTRRRAARCSSPSASCSSSRAPPRLHAHPGSRFRIETWLDPYADPQGAGYQTIRASTRWRAAASAAPASAAGRSRARAGTRTSLTSTRTSSSPRSRRSSASPASPRSCSRSWCCACAASALPCSPRTASRSCSLSASPSASRSRRSSSSAASSGSSP
jgi:hypothetical protein